jgi:hypothetical protein
MACIDMPHPVLPTLPGGLSVGFTLPGASFDPKLCCKVLQFSAVLPPTPFAIPLNPGTIAAINAFIGEIQTFIDAIAVPCPKESA